MQTNRHQMIRQLFDEYIEMYASRDERLYARFSDNFSGFAGSSDVLVDNMSDWVDVTRQDFAQVPGHIRIEMLDLSIQDLCEEVAVVTAFFHIHLPGDHALFAKEVARLVLVLRQESNEWKIAHSSISIPYRQATQGEVYPLKSLQDRNSELEALVQQRTLALLESQSLYQLLTEDARDVVWRTDKNLHITYISPADERLRGFRADEVIGHHVFDMFTEEGVALVKELMGSRHAAEKNGNFVGFLTFEVEHRCKDGHLIWGEVLSKPERDAQGIITGYHGITRDVTERRLMGEQVRQMAFHDPLTHLANRRLMEDRLSQALATAERIGSHGAVLFLDLDNFKPLNDAHGHGAGDMLLMEVANRLRSCVRKGDTVARFGGDEFVVLLNNMSRDPELALAEAAAIAEKIRIGLAAPYLLQGELADAPLARIEHHCTASMGVAVFDGLSATTQEIIGSADTAMYRAKEEGRNRICFATT